MSNPTDTSTSQPGPRIREIPLKPIDQRAPVGDIRTIVFFVIRQHLNEELLRQSLDNLIRNHLPILGSRIRRTGEKGPLVYHLPEAFAPDALLFAWSSSLVSTTLDESRLLPDVPDSKCAINWGPDVTKIEDKWTPSDWPREFVDDGPDTPLVLVHLTKYTDATILAINVPHAVSDQKGLGSMVQAWLAVARGEQPEPFIELEEDALNGPSDISQSELRRKGEYRLKTKGEHIRSIMSFMPDIIRNRKEDRRVLFLSGTAVAALREKCNKSLGETHGADVPVVTNGDIVTCVLAKLANLHRKKPMKLAIGETVNARGRCDTLPVDKHYLHNCPAYACARLKFSRDTPLSELARLHRLSVIETSKPANIERSFAVSLGVYNGGYAFPLNGPGETSYHVTNWSSAWHNLDFSSVIDPSTGTNSVKGVHGAAVYGGSGNEPSLLVLGHAVQRKHSIHRCESSWSVPGAGIVVTDTTDNSVHAPVMCKANGGYWCDFACSTKTMALVEELLQRDPMLDSL